MGGRAGRPACKHEQKQEDDLFCIKNTPNFQLQAECKTNEKFPIHSTLQYDLIREGGGL